MRFLFSVAAAAVALFGSLSSYALEQQSHIEEQLVFFDNFTTFDHSVWKHEITLSGGGNWEFEQYRNNRSNSWVSDGILHIKPTLTADVMGDAAIVGGAMLDINGGQLDAQCTDPSFYGCSRTSGGNSVINPVMSARLRTAESFSFRYGRVEVRAKFPRGDWLWPAIWMLPRRFEYGDWPASGEIDIIESRGNVGYPSQYGGGPETVGTTLHWGPHYGADPFALTHATYSLPTGDFSQDFHTFGLYWNETVIYTYVDVDDAQHRILTVDLSKKNLWQQALDAGYQWQSQNCPWNHSTNLNAPFDQEFFLIFNLAVGGVSDYFKDGVAGKPWTDASVTAARDFWNAKGQWYPTWDSEHSQLQIDWVKVWTFVRTKKGLQSQSNLKSHPVSSPQIDSMTNSGPSYSYLDNVISSKLQPPLYQSNADSFLQQQGFVKSSSNEVPPSSGISLSTSQLIGIVAGTCFAAALVGAALGALASVYYVNRKSREAARLVDSGSHRVLDDEAFQRMSSRTELSNPFGTSRSGYDAINA